MFADCNCTPAVFNDIPAIQWRFYKPHLFKDWIFCCGLIIRCLGDWVNSNYEWTWWDELTLMNRNQLLFGRDIMSPNCRWNTCTSRTSKWVRVKYEISYLLCDFKNSVKMIFFKKVYIPNKKVSISIYRYLYLYLFIDKVCIYIFLFWGKERKLGTSVHTSPTLFILVSTVTFLGVAVGV